MKRSPTASADTGRRRSNPVASMMPTSFAPTAANARERVSRPLARPRFEISSGEDERGDTGRNVEVDRPGRAVHQHEQHGVRHAAGITPEHRVERPHRRGDDAQRHERVHGGQSVTGGTNGRPVERPRRPRYDRGRQCHHEPLPTREAQIRRHRECNRRVAQWHEEESGDEQSPPQVPYPAVDLFPAIPGPVLRGKLGGIAGGNDLLDEPPDADVCGQDGRGRALRRN